MALCNVQALMDQAACFACLPPGMQQAIELQLLCEVLGVINPANLQEVFPDHYGGVVPTFVPLSNHAIANDLDAPFQIYVWNPETQTWA